MSQRQPKARVLVIDDEHEILRILKSVLTNAGYAVSVASSGEEGMELFGLQPFDAVLLDLRMPGLSGLEVCAWLRARSDVPIIVLSVMGEENDKVRALDTGADDYLVKPFGVAELLARLRAALRRAGSKGQPEMIVRSGDLTIDLERRAVYVAGQLVRLTPTEYDVLKCLAVHGGKVVTHRMLLREVWGSEQPADTSNLRYTITQIRRKLGDDPTHPRYILTEPGVGYRLMVDG
ncbi:two component transcriptional regulator, winged helix family [Thermobaculum terrenum ATCC BAA-798]|uniref:Two component transcriptional regulator, winged helix family n=1 Tax=Thermobaculum terrenum (strain ATCC BAA-798 / CCMEE 7001 / YNP1) TaxID=525904 RepID=D1CGU9_THET1|nr:response regulator transcription factor [Thermobaculum terrenum]ACZ42970.1 two component transcriptional regulator, winged helix family [Thermobaculum terrenum ATCC BAA-798]